VRTLPTDVERLEAAVSRIARRKGLGDLHSYLKSVTGVDIDRAGYAVLRKINDGPTRITDLAVELGVEPSTISRHVQRLEERGLLERVRDPKDRRATLVDTSGQGFAVVRRVEEDRRRILALILESWDADERRIFVDLMERFAADLIEAIESMTAEERAS
jgi:DNA-binding MarR family transcriptional regulator